MKKISSQQIHGNEYIQLSRLPFEQLMSFRDWIGEADRLLIKDTNGFEQEYAHYDVYDFWFDTFKSERPELDYAIF